MRTILRGETVLADVGKTDRARKGDGDALTLLKAADDWHVLEGPGFETAEIRGLYETLTKAVGEQSLPVLLAVDDPLITRTLATPAYQAPSLRHAAAQALRLLLQEDPIELASDINADRVRVAVHYRLNAYAVVSARGPLGQAFTVRIRHPDRAHVEEATESIATALMSKDSATLDDGRIVSKVRTKFTPTPVLREAGGTQNIELGAVIELRGSRSIIRLAFGASSRALGITGVVLTIISAVLFFVVGDDAGSSVAWIDGVIGRLATAFFGASAIATTERALTYRGKLRTDRTGASYAAVIVWSRVD